jgi:hypothetical protein
MLTHGIAGMPPGLEGAFQPGIAGVTGGLRPSSPWDVVVSLDAPDLPGERIELFTLADGTLVLDATVPDGALDPLVEAVEKAITPPYGAAGVRHDGDLWALAAWSVDLLELPGLPDGEELVVSRVDGRVEAAIDGVEVQPPATLLAVLRGQSGDVALVAEPVDGDVWAAEITPL